MKIAELKTFIVGNPPPAFGGRYFVFLKLKTACGVEGVGEVYAASFAPKAIVAMIEDVFERHVEGADPFRIEALWRNVYGRGYSGRPDISLMGVLSGIEMALWDIVGKAVGKPSTRCSAARFTSGCALTPISIRTSRARTPIRTVPSIRIRTPQPRAL